MGKFFKGLSIGLLSTTVLLAGCQSTSGGSTGSASRTTSPLDNDEFSVDNSSTLIACGAGALATGLLCLALAGDNKEACIVAAGAGCALAAGGNALLDNLRKNYHTQEQQLDALLTTVEENNSKASRMVAAAQNQYKSDQAILQQIERDLAQNRGNYNQIKQQLALTDANIKVLRTNIDSHKEQLESFELARQGIVSDGALNAAERNKLAEYDRQIAQLRKSINSMNATMQSYVHDRDVLDLAATRAATQGVGV